LTITPNASESIPLAILDYITKTGAVEEELINLSIAYIEVKDDVSFSTIKIEDLPEDWNTYPGFISMRYCFVISTGYELSFRH